MSGESASENLPPRLRIDRVLSLPERGVVLYGTVEQGVITAGAHVTVTREGASVLTTELLSVTTKNEGQPADGKPGDIVGLRLKAPQDDDGDTVDLFTTVRIGDSIGPRAD
ncbi:hypothetical protein ABZW10_04150 [Kitasatospora sp. NPDC004723]|uniref:hypothetical protein n=1 Tax=Kitasatospora sp. NPDC004723 TaxID=3154288 RepID=UPI0033BC2143